MKIDKKSFLKAMLISLAMGFLVVIFLIIPGLSTLPGEGSGWNISTMGKILTIVVFLGIFLISFFFAYFILTGLKIPKEERMRRRDLWLKESKEYPYGRDSKTFWHNFKIWVGFYIFGFSCVLFMLILTGFYSFPLLDMIFLIFLFISFPI
ncbi:MAG: hypothetical protein NTV74_06215 [Euryarchaeota archaeon]|nr:hypothetical protein [Euryarchaeota archaeon]